MIALLLSLLLIGGVVQIYLGTKSTYKVTGGLSRLQGNTRFSTDMIARDIRMAGYIPCSQPQAQLNVIGGHLCLQTRSEGWRMVTILFLMIASMRYYQVQTQS